MFYFMNFVRSFMNYAIFRELCDRMRFEVDCAKSHHHVIPEGLSIIVENEMGQTLIKHGFLTNQSAHRALSIL